jgi:hypothetical protein
VLIDYAANQAAVDDRLRKYTAIGPEEILRAYFSRQSAVTGSRPEPANKQPAVLIVGAVHRAEYAGSVCADIPDHPG